MKRSDAVFEPPFFISKHPDAADTVSEKGRKQNQKIKIGKSIFYVLRGESSNHKLRKLPEQAWKKGKGKGSNLAFGVTASGVGGWGAGIDILRETKGSRNLTSGLSIYKEISRMDV